MQFWSTVTFRAENEAERSNLRSILRSVRVVDPSLTTGISGTAEALGDVEVVVSAKQARGLAEALQKLTLDNAQQDQLRRGMVRALAFAQHYVHHENGWDPAEVVERHNLRAAQRA